MGKISGTKVLHRVFHELSNQSYDRMGDAGGGRRSKRDITTKTSANRAKKKRNPPYPDSYDLKVKLKYKKREVYMKFFDIYD